MSKFMIIDDNGVIWSSSSADAQDEGQAILDAVENGTGNKFVKDNLGDSWTGDLVLVQEISRTR